MKRVSRNRVRVSYYEPEEPGFDEYVFCSSCGDYVYEYCSIHGPLLIIPDDQVSTPTGYPALVPRSALTVPRIFLHLAPSTIPGAGIGVFSTMTLPPGVRFGPYRGLKTEESTSTYCWQIFDRDHKPAHVLDARDPNKSNWMRYVNCSRHHTEQNLVAYQYRGQLYYRTIKIIPRFMELLVFYGSEFASALDIDIRRYHAPVYADILVNAEHGAQKTKSQHGDNEDTSIVDVKEGPKNSITREFTNESIFETKVSSETTSNIELECLNENNVPEIEDQNKVECDSFVFNGCEETFKEKAAITEYIAHSSVKNEIKKSTIHLCLICNCRFVNKSQLINHQIQIHDSKIQCIECSQCDYKTVSGRDFKKHVDRHNKSAPKIACKICGLRFSDLNKLTIHSKMHAADRLFACTICGCRFKTNKLLKNHLVVHNEEKPHSCKICNKSFSRKYALKRHIELHMNPSAIAVELAGPAMSKDGL